MLSTISSFLPSVVSSRLEKLDLLSDNKGEKQQANDNQVKEQDMVEESNKKEKKKKVSSYETYIVVRPPPAMSNHPLNLQLQLVPAYHSRDRPTSVPTTPITQQTPDESADGHELAQPSSQSPPSPSASESDNGLNRTPSTRSNRSEASTFYSSATAASSGSVTSFSSTTSTSSGRRMIIPLYNLSAHNVMVNTVLDAGTDARVAKFHKRNLEIIDLALIEPTEVWYGKERAHDADVGAASYTLGVPIQRCTSGNSSLAPPGQIGSRAGTPDPSHSPGSSRLSLSSDHSSSAAHHQTSVPVSTPVATPTGPKKLFGRIFRKKEGSGSGKPPPSTPDSSTPSAKPSPPKSVTPVPELRLGKQSSMEVVLPAILGLSPTLSAATNPPTGRCVSYVWTVRKWLKTDNHGLISGVIGKIGREASVHGIGHAGLPVGLEWEVRFDWVRGRKSKSPKDKKRASYTSGTPSRRHSRTLGLEDDPDDKPAMSESPRQSLDVPNPSSRAPSPQLEVPINVLVTSKSDAENQVGHGDDAADESDPEDSETPWTCSMILTHSSAPLPHLTSMFSKGHFRTRTMSSSRGVEHFRASSAVVNHQSSVSESGHLAPPIPPPIKLKVASLSPAPHHPKVVCQLKIPFPLPDVEVENGRLRKRLVLADGSTRSTVPVHRGSGAQSLILTAEEIKDVVCSTAFWLVVREGFGGVGKKNRKGDGWNIRG